MAVPPNYEACFAAASKAAGRKLDEREMEFYFEKSQGRMNRYIREGMTPEQAADRAGADLGDEAKLARAIERRQARINALRQTGLTERVVPGRLVDSALAVVGGLAEWKGAFRNSALSLDAMGLSRVADTTHAFMTDLENSGLLKAFRKADPNFERDVANELGRMDDPTWGRDTGNAQAKRMAEVIYKHQDAMRLAENDAGAYIGKLDQYMTRQSHDRHKIAAAGFEQWRDFIQPRLGERTFQDMLDQFERDQFMRETYNSLATGIHDTPQGDDWIAGFKGPANLAKKLSQERKLFFASADAWLEYNKQFGNGSLNGTVLSTLERGSRAVEAMNLLGTNPRAMLDGWVDRLASQAKDAGDIEQATALAKNKEKVLRVYDRAMRAPVVAENETMASFFATVRDFQRFKLGGSVISSFADLAGTAAMARHNGIGMLESMSWHMSQLLPDSEGRRQAAREAAVGLDSFTHSLQTRFGLDEGIPGKLTKSVDSFYRLTGMPYWTDSMRQGSVLMLMNNLAERAGQSFDQLAPRLQTTLKRYGIEADEWDAIRAIPSKAPDGHKYIFAGDAPTPELRTKLSTYLRDQANEGMNEETAGLRDMLLGTTRPGTLSGELWRSAVQFKQFPVSFFVRSFLREVGRDGVDVSGMAKLIAATTAIGYLSASLKDIARGKEPIGPWGDHDAGDYTKAVLRAMQTGGGLGFYGDVLFGDAGRDGKGALPGMLGPAFGMANDVAAALYFKPKEAAIEGKLDAGRVASDALAAAKNNAPFINLFYTRAALDYGVLYSLQETLNPGYLRRFEQNVKKQGGQNFLLSPAQDHLPVFGR